MDIQMTRLVVLLEVMLFGAMALLVPILWHQSRGRPWFWFYSALGRGRFWKTVLSLFLLGSFVSFCTYLAMFAATSGLPPWTVVLSSNTSEALLIGWLVSAIVSCAAGTCLMKALHASVMARDMAAFHRMYTTVGFVVICLGGAGVALGQSVPQNNSYPRYSQVEIMASGAQTIDASVVVAGTRIKPMDGGRLQVGDYDVAAEDPHGQLSVEIELRGVPKSEVDIVVEYFDLENITDITDITDAAIDSGGFSVITIYPSRVELHESWKVNVDASTTGNCVMSATKSDFAYETPLVVRGRALLDSAGSATVWMAWDVKHGWTESTGGGRNTVSLPGISIPVAVPGGCTIDSGAKMGTWEFPESSTGSVKVAALLPVDAQISAHPPLDAPDGGLDE